jgi:hypothetical protein
MKKTIVGLVTVLIIVVGFLLLLRGNENTWICQNGSWVKNGNPKASMPTKPCVATTVNSTSTVNPNANIQLLSPKAGDTVGSQFVIRGSAKVFENQLNFRVKNAKGLSLIEGTMVAQAAAAGKFGPFEATVSSVPAGKATIEVFDKSAKDGSEIDKVSVQVSVK